MSTPTEQDQAFPTRVFALAQRSRDEGHHPLAAIVVGADGGVIAEAMNDSVSERTAHAEMNALRAASRIYDPAVLAGATLYSRAEPCAMCAGGTYWSGVGRVVHGLSEASLLSLTGSDPENPTLSLPCREIFARGQRPSEVIGPLREDEARHTHEGFWRKDWRARGSPHDAGRERRLLIPQIARTLRPSSRARRRKR